jgi:hypothetical protein
VNYREASVEVVVAPVGPGSVATGREDAERQGRDDDSARHLLRLRDLSLYVPLGLLAAIAGIGLLYLLRNAGIAHIGPNQRAALPLEQLDGTDGQPLARMALAWLPVGVATGAVVAAFTRSSRALALGVIGLAAGAALMLTASASDAVANNERFTAHLTTPLGAAGPWVSLVLLVIGVAVGEALVAVAWAPSAA